MSVVTLANQLTGQSAGGYFVFLGHSATAQVAANSQSSNCFGLIDPDDVPSSPIGDPSNADTSPAILEWIGTASQNPYNVDPNTVPVAQGQTYPENHSFDFLDMNTGYYGFMYIVGDNDPTDGVLTGSECGGVTCFEVEVVEGTVAIPDADASYCSNSTPATIDLGDILNSTDYTGTGTWTATTGNLGTIAGDVVTVTPSPPTAGTYVFTYTQTVSSSTHAVDMNCPTCEEETTRVNIVITEELAAGTAKSLAVCN